MPECAKVRRVKTPEQRGVIGAWAYRSRQETDLTPDQVVERLRAEGYAVTASTIRGVEGGSKKPSARLRRLLGKVYGSEPPGSTEPDSADLTSAIAAMTALAEEMRDAMAEQRALTRAVVRVAEVLAGLRLGPEERETLEPVVRGGTRT